jgi:hypothetical protein
MIYQYPAATKKGEGAVSLTRWRWPTRHTRGVMRNPPASRAIKTHTTQHIGVAQHAYPLNNTYKYR